MDLWTESEITKMLQEFREFAVAYDEGKKAQEELTQFVTLLREELKIARDAEKTAVASNSRYLGFINQQQDIITKLLTVKEENEILKQKKNELEKTIFDIEKNSTAEQIKKEAEIHKMKQDYFLELVKIQETADASVMKMKSDLNSDNDRLMLEKSKCEEKIQEQRQIIECLQSKIRDLKEKEAVNVDIFQKKLAEQERQHQAELETWELAELQHSTQYESNLYQTNRQMSKYENLTTVKPDINTFSNNQMLSHGQSYSNQQPSLISRSRNLLPSARSNIVRPLPRSLNENHHTTSSTFQSASELYYNNFEVNNDENKEENLEKQTLSKPKIPVPNKRRKLFNPDYGAL